MIKDRASPNSEQIGDESPEFYFWSKILALFVLVLWGGLIIVTIRFGYVIGLCAWVLAIALVAVAPYVHGDTRKWLACARASYLRLALFPVVVMFPPMFAAVKLEAPGLFMTLLFVLFGCWVWYCWRDYYRLNEVLGGPKYEDTIVASEKYKWFDVKRMVENEKKKRMGAQD